MKPAEQLDRLAALVQASPLNLVSASDRALVRTRHVEESWQVGEVLNCQPAQRWMDLGTGGGFPGLALAIRFPETRFTLLDSVRKKLEAIKRLASELQLTNVRAVWDRAERVARMKGERQAYDGVVSRAVGSLLLVAELSRGFLRPDGRLMIVKGPAVVHELAELRAWHGPLRLTEPVVSRVEHSGRDVRVVAMTATGAAPDWVPRAVGLPGKQPLAVPPAVPSQRD
ncbi:MAG: 16S rRNA (guanine(527)-N(7))-methyltransferase RsmG [Egibacteraceae bacterium]